MGCLLSGVRVAKMKCFAVSLLLVGFMAAGARLIWLETTPEKHAATPTGFAVYDYQNPFEVERQAAPKPEETPAESVGMHLSFTLWLVGMPLAALGGLGMGPFV